MAPRSKAQPAEQGEHVDLVSPSANLWISLTTNVDDYSGLGGMRTVQRGDRIRFKNGRARVPAAWKDDIESTPGFGTHFFYAVDPKAVVATGGPTIIGGQVMTRMASEPPLPDWDETAPRELRASIENGEVTDLQGALAYEGAHKARHQVLIALGSAIRGGDDEDEGGDEGAAAEAHDMTSGDRGSGHPETPDGLAETEANKAAAEKAAVKGGK